MAALVRDALAFVQSIAAGELDVEELRRNDLARCAELLRKYPSIGFTDASIIAMAERLKIETVATTDRRHFAAVRPKHVKGFELVRDRPSG